MLKKLRRSLVTTITGVALGAALLVLPACGGTGESAGGQDGEAKQVKVLLPFPFAVAFFQWYVAKGQGYFEEEGLDVTIESAEGSGAVVQQLIAGNIKYGAPGPGPVIEAAAQGSDLVAVYVAATRLPYQLVALADSPISTIADLKGKKVGVSEATGGEVPFLKALLAENGIDPDTGLDILEAGGGAAAAGALRSGRIDAFMSDYFSIRELRGTIDVNLFDLGRFEQFHDSSLVVTRDTYDEERDTIVGLGRALAKASVFADESPEAALKVVAELVPDQVTDPEGFDLAALRDTIAVSEPYEESDGRWGYSRPESWEGYVSYLTEQGDLAGEVEPESLYTNDLIDEMNDFDADEIREQARKVAAS